MEFVKAVRKSEVADGKAKKVFCNGQALVVANVNGRFYAVNDTCPHWGGSLAEGVLEDGCISCPRHKAKFDITTGKVVREPKVLFLKMKVKDAQAYPVRVEGNDVLVGIELPAPTC